MGYLNFECLAKDETTMTMYGLAVGPDYSSSDKKDRLILIKSNTHPKSVDDMSWKVVSTIGRDKLLYLYGKLNDGRLACAVDPTGVFTAFSQAAGPTTSIPEKSTPGGIRYDPALPATADSTGQGGWQVIMASPDYDWSSTLMRSILFPVKEPAPSNKYSLVHVYSNSSSEIHFGSLASSSQNFTRLDTIWKPDIMTYGSSAFFIISTTLSTTCVILPSTLRVALSRNRLFIVCMNPTVDGVTSMVHYYDGTKFQPPVDMQKYFPFQVPSEAIEGTDGKPPFVFIQDSNIGQFASISIDMEGPKFGQVVTTNSRVNVTEPYGTPFSSSDRGSGVNPDNTHDPNNGGISPTIIGAIIGAVTGVITIIWAIVKCRRQRKINAAQQAMFDEQKIQQVEPPLGGDGATAVYPNVQYAGGTGPTPGGPYATPAPDLPNMTMHPRPQFFTSLAEPSKHGGEPDAILGNDPSVVPVPPGAVVYAPPPLNQQPATDFQNHQHQSNDEQWAHKVPHSTLVSGPQALLPPTSYDQSIALTSTSQSVISASNYLNSTTVSNNLHAPQVYPAGSTLSSFPPTTATPTTTLNVPISTSSTPTTTIMNLPPTFGTSTKPPPSLVALGFSRPPNNPHAYIEPSGPRQPAGAVSGTSYAEFRRNDDDNGMINQSNHHYQYQHLQQQQSPQQLQQQPATQSYSDLSGSTLTPPSSTYSASPIPSSAGTYYSQESWTPVIPTQTQPPR
ncbi:hypothetical protein BGW42_006062 [Actinomortierella wolfii]|nr:hypothetical protein BGW42_006062 [Actinomortierella wolfii]